MGSSKYRKDEERRLSNFQGYLRKEWHNKTKWCDTQKFAKNAVFVHYDLLRLNTEIR